MEIEEVEGKSNIKVQAEMRRKVLQFARIIDVKLEELSPSMVNGKLKAEHYRGGFYISYYYQRDLRHNNPVFTIEEPISEISFEFLIESPISIRRTIFDGTIDRYYSNFDTERMVSSKLITLEEMNELISVMQAPKSYSKNKLPDSLVRIDQNEELLLNDRKLPIWSLPHQPR